MDRNDVSAPLLGTQENYDARCTCCWLGHGHTVDYHNKVINNTPSVRRYTVTIGGAGEASQIVDDNGATLVRAEPNQSVMGPLITIKDNS